VLKEHKEIKGLKGRQVDKVHKVPWELRVLLELKVT